MTLDETLELFTGRLVVAEIVDAPALREKMLSRKPKDRKLASAIMYGLRQVYDRSSTAKPMLCACCDKGIRDIPGPMVVVRLADDPKDNNVLISAVHLECASDERDMANRILAWFQRYAWPDVREVSVANVIDNAGRA